MFATITSSFRKPSTRLTCFCFTALWGAGVLGAPAEAATIRVPDDQPTIQAAIDVAMTGDVVLVEAGTYAEAIDFQGKAIIVRSESGATVTTIDPGAVLRATRPRIERHFERRVFADGTVEMIEAAGGRPAWDARGVAVADSLLGGNEGSVVVFDDDETRASVLDGFTITGGDADFGGGGIRIEGGAAPTVINNVIDDNRACSEGAGITIAFSSPLIEGNVISNNQQIGCSGGSGGGIAVRGAASAEIRGNVIFGNSFTFGGGISLFAAGTPTIADNLIYGNTSGSGGGGFDIVNVSDAFIVQNVVRNNAGASGAGDGFDWLVPSAGRGPILLNNSIARNGDRDVFADGFDVEAELVNNVIVANSGGTAIFCGNFNDTNPPVFHFNNVFAPSGTAYGGICGNPTGSNGNLSADPLFADAASGDLRLLEGSPSIDAGDNAAPDLPMLDLDGNSRVLDGDGNMSAVVDQGAYERLPDGPIFNDGFETGDTSNWSATVP